MITLEKGLIGEDEEEEKGGGGWAEEIHGGLRCGEHGDIKCLLNLPHPDGGKMMVR